MPPPGFQPYDDLTPGLSSVPGFQPYDNEEEEQPEPSWWENIATVPNAIRFGLSAIGDVSAPVTFGTGPFIGGAAGEGLARWWEGKEFDPSIMALEGAMNYIPGAGALPSKGAGLKEIAKYAARSAGHGAWQGAAGSLPRHQAETGNLFNPNEWEMPSMGEIGSQTLGGAVIGGITGGTLASGNVFRNRPKPPIPPKPWSAGDMTGYQQMDLGLEGDLRQPDLPFPPRYIESGDRSPKVGGLDEPYFYDYGPQQQNLPLEPPDDGGQFDLFNKGQPPPPTGGIPPPVPPPPVPPPPAPAQGQKPQVITLKNAGDPVEAEMYRQQGYVSVAGLRNAQGQVQMVRGDVAPLYVTALKNKTPLPQEAPVQQPVMPPDMVPVGGEAAHNAQLPPQQMAPSPQDVAYRNIMEKLKQQVPGPIGPGQIAGGDTVVVPKAQANNPTFIENMKKNGYIIASADNENVTFKRGPSTANDEGGPPDEGKPLDWSQRPPRQPLHGDEEIPDLAFQPDEGVASNREFQERFLPRPEVTNSTSRIEIDEETRIAPEGRMNEIATSYPSILEEAKIIYNETDPQVIAENLRRYSAEQKEIWARFNRAQHEKNQNNIPVPPELTAAYNRIFRLRDLAQAKYERAGLRSVRGRPETVGEQKGGFWGDIALDEGLPPGGDGLTEGINNALNIIRSGQGGADAEFNKITQQIDQAIDPVTTQNNANTIRHLRDLASQEGNFDVYGFLQDLYEHAHDRHRAIAGEGMPPPGAYNPQTGERGGASIGLDTPPPRLQGVFDNAVASLEDVDAQTLLEYYRHTSDAIDWLTTHNGDPNEIALHERMHNIIEQKINTITSDTDITEWPPNSDTFVYPVRQPNVEAQPGLFGGPIEATPLPPPRAPIFETPDSSIQRNFQFEPEEIPPPSSTTMDPRMAARVEAGGPREFDFTSAHPEQGQLFPTELRRNQMMDSIGEFHDPADVDEAARLIMEPDQPRQLSMEGDMKDAEIADYLRREDATPPEMEDLSKYGPDKLLPPEPPRETFGGQSPKGEGEANDTNWENWTDEYLRAKFKKLMGINEELSAEELAAYRQQHGPIPGENEQVPVLPGRDMVFGLDKETSEAFIPNAKEAIDFWQRRIDEFSEIGDIEGVRLAQENQDEARYILERLEGRDSRGQLPSDTLDEGTKNQLQKLTDLIKRLEKQGDKIREMRSNNDPDYWKRYINSRTHDPRDIAALREELGRLAELNPQRGTREWTRIDELVKILEGFDETGRRPGDLDLSDMPGPMWKENQPPTRQQLIDSLYEDARALGLNPDDYPKADPYGANPLVDAIKAKGGRYNEKTGRWEAKKPTKPSIDALHKSDPMATAYIETIQNMGTQNTFELNHRVVEAKNLILKAMRETLSKEEIRRFHQLAEDIRTSPDLKPHYQQSFKFDEYELPDGTIIKVDATATKSVPEFDFQMKDGKIVKAVRKIRNFLKDEEGSFDPNAPFKFAQTVGRAAKEATGWGSGRSDPSGPDEFNFIREALALPSAATTTGDFSAPGRQGLSMILTPQFWSAAGNMFKGLSSRGFDQIDADLRNKPIFTPRIDSRGNVGKSYADEIGMKLFNPASRLGPRAESTASRWMETGGSIPGVSAAYRHTIGVPVRATNRAYITFLNHLNANRTEFLLNKARDMSIEALNTGRARQGLMPWKQSFTPQEAMDLNPYHNLTLGKEIADFVNTATGHAPLKIHLLPLKQAEVSFEGSAKALNMALFSPGLLFSRMRMMNPSTYIMASPFVRKQYLKAAVSTAAAWYGFTELAKLAGGDDVEVSNQITSADFGKVRVGDTRLDPGGGFLQFLVAYGRLYQGGTTSSASGEFHRFGTGYQAETQEDSAERFFVNKLNPVAKFAYDLASASEYKPFHVKDRLIQMFVPLIAQDMIELAKEDPDLLPWMGTAATFGMGTQTYSKGESVGKLIDPEKDWLVTGGGLRDLIPGAEDY